MIDLDQEIAHWNPSERAAVLVSQLHDSIGKFVLLRTGPLFTAPYQDRIGVLTGEARFEAAYEILRLPMQVHGSFYPDTQQRRTGDVCIHYLHLYLPSSVTIVPESGIRSFLNEKGLSVPYKAVLEELSFLT